MPYHFSVQHQKRYSTHVNRSTTLFRKGSKLHSCPFDIPYQRPRYVTQNDLFSLLQFSFIEPLNAKTGLSFSTVVRFFASVALFLKRKLMSHRRYPFKEPQYAVLSWRFSRLVTVPMNALALKKVSFSSCLNIFTVWRQWIISLCVSRKAIDPFSRLSNAKRQGPLWPLLLENSCRKP